MEPWRVLSSKYVIDNYPFNRTREDRCVLPNGLEIVTHVLEYPDWVNAVVLTKNMDMVLVRQYRHGVGDFITEIPGGMIDDGEPAIDAIVREVQEETGYRSKATPVFLGSFYPNTATANNRVSSYLFVDAEPIEEQHLDDTEDVTVHLVPFSEFESMIERGEAPQIFSVLAYHLAKQHLKV